MATPVQEALRGISGTLERGFTGLGKQRLAEAQSGFQRAILGQQLQHYERFVKPGLEAQEAYLNQPANFGDLISDEMGAIHIAQYVQPKIKKMYGADRWEGLTLVKKDGTPVTNRDRQLRRKDEARLIYLNMKPSSLWKDQSQRVDNLLINMVEHHENPASPEFQKAIRNQQVTRQNAFNPQKWIEDSQRQLQVASMYPDIYKEEIAQIRRNIMEYRKMLVPKKEVPFSQTKSAAEYERETKLMLEREKQKTKQLEPTEKLTDLKVKAWKKYFDGTATKEEKELIGVDYDPFITRAAQMVVGDYRYLNTPAKDKAKAAISLAETLREASERSKAGLPPLEPETEYIWTNEKGIHQQVTGAAK